MPPQAPEPAAPDQVEQHRFGVVPGMVGGGDSVRTGLFRRILQKGVAQLTGGLLDAGTRRGGLGRHVSPAGVAGDFILRAPVPDKPFLRLRLGAELVVEVGGGHGDVQGRLEGQQGVEQAHGVRTAGDRCEYPAPRREHVPGSGQLPELPQYDVLHGGHS